MRLVASCLRLLTAMVAQGPNAAREVQRMFNFGYKPLEVFPTRTHIVQVCIYTLLSEKKNVFSVITLFVRCSG